MYVIGFIEVVIGYNSDKHSFSLGFCCNLML